MRVSKSRQPEDLLEGSVHETNFNDKVLILEYISSKNIVVEFVSTKYQTSVSAKELRHGCIKDRSKRSVFGVGFVGNGLYNSKSKSYSYWHSMVRRCYSTVYQQRKPTYNGCEVCEDWKDFQKFSIWFDVNYPYTNVDCQLDKDLLGDGKYYSPDTAVFVSSKVNTFINDSGKSRGDYMIGVSYTPYCNKNNPYIANCQNPFNKSNRGYIGYYPTELEAHKAWQAKKHEYACQLADLQEDERVAKALRERYAPDKDWTNN